MSPRPDVSEERRSQILTAATAVFARLGFHPARMDDIARESGLSKGALYLYFTSKDDLIAAILRRLFARELGALEDALAARDQPAGVRLRRLTAHMVTEIERLAILRPIWFEFYALAARQRGVRRALRDYFADYHERLATLIRQGIDAGEFRPADPTATATALIALFEGLALLWGLDPRGLRVGEASEAAIGLFLDGLRAPTDRAQ